MNINNTYTGDLLSSQFQLQVSHTQQSVTEV